MELSEYYQKVFGKLNNCFQHSHFVLGYGRELIRYGWDPNNLLVTVEPTHSLWDLTVNKELEIFIPVLGSKNEHTGRVDKCEAILMPFDFEIFLQDFKDLYAKEDSQFHYFQKYISPVKNYLADKLENHNIPYLLDYTPSGGHFLTYIKRDTKAWDALKEIGYEDNAVFKAYDFLDRGDLKRNPAPGKEAASVYSGICILAEYLALKTKQDVEEGEGMPITIWDSENKCMNIDISWTADPAFMRIIRSPFGAHKKRSQKFGMGSKPLVDVIGRYFDGPNNVILDSTETDLNMLIKFMWNLDHAVAHSHEFSGYIPCSDEGIVSLVNEYKDSNLKKHHDYCHSGYDLSPGDAAAKALRDERLSEKTKSVVEIPYPRMLQPRDMKKFVRDMFINGDWHPRHIKNLMADKYREEDHDWGINFWKYHPDKKAWAFARQYSSVAKMEQGWRI